MVPTIALFYCKLTHTYWFPTLIKLREFPLASNLHYNLEQKHLLDKKKTKKKQPKEQYGDTVY